MKKIVLNESQKLFLKKNYIRLTYNELSEVMGISKKVLARYLKEWNLKKPTNYNKKITPEIEFIIKKEYPYRDSEELAKEIGIATGTLKNYCIKNNIKKVDTFTNYHKSKLTQLQKEFIIDNYSSMPSNLICKKIGIDYIALSNYARSRGLKKNIDINYNLPNKGVLYQQKRKNQKDYNIYDKIGKVKEPNVPVLYKSKYGKYTYNNNYFETIDNEWKAYWLGFLYADGWVRKKKNSIGLSLAIRDKEHLIKFKKSLQSNHKFYYYNSRGFDSKKTKSYPAVSLRITNEKMTNDLIRLGCIPNKSLVLKFPIYNQVPKDLIRHFIRGYFDGDGWIWVNDTPKIGVGFCGTINMLKEIKKNLISTLNITDIKIKPKYNEFYGEMAWGSFTDCEKIFKYFYSDVNIWLERKLKKFDTIFCL